MENVPKAELFNNTLYVDYKYGVLEANILGYIRQWEKKGRECFASREELAEAFCVSETRIQDSIKRLERANAITVEHRNGRLRVLHSNPRRHKGIGNQSVTNNAGIGIQPVRDRISPPEGSEFTPLRDRNPIATNTSTKIITNIKTSTSTVVPRDLFLDWYNSASKEQIQETINQAMSHANRLQVKLLSGPDGSGKVSALRNYWESQQ